MPLHSLHRSLALLGIALALLAEARGQARVYRTDNTATHHSAPKDPGDIYLRAYNLIRESEMLAGRQSFNAAIQRGQEAEKLLATLVRDFPQWKQNLIQARRRLLAENLANYRKNASAVSDAPKTRQPGASAEITQADLVSSPEQPSPFLTDDYPLPHYETTDKKLYNALAVAQEERRRISKAYQELHQRFMDVQKKLVATQMEQKMYKERYESLLEQVTAERAAGNSVVESLSRQVAELESKYLASQNELKEAQSRASELEERLSETQSSLEQVTRERDTLFRENEQLRALVELNSPEKTKALLDQNITLAEQLKTAQQKITELESMQSGAADQSEILASQLEEARAEANRLREEMNSIYDENMGYRKRVSELTERLNNLEADLAAQDDRLPLDPALAEENKLLRELIDKQRSALAMQEASRNLLIETYKSLKNNDPAVLEALKKLDEESSIELTPGEQQLVEQIRQKLARPDTADDAGGELVRHNLEIETLAELADKAFSKGRFISAEQLYLTLYDLQPDHVAGLVNLSTILLHNNKSEQSLQYLSRAIRLAPDIAICYHLAGIAYYRLEQLTEAQKMFARTVQLDPGNAEAFFYLANIEGITRSYESALKHYAAAVKIKPELADAHYNMARLYAETGKIPESARAYDRAIHNGAIPDPEFELFLRQHPDSGKRPEPDLVETIQPEQEAQKLDAMLPPEIAQKSDTAPPAEQTADTPQENTLLSAFQKHLDQVATPVGAAPTPSPAGAQHESDSSKLSIIRMKTRLGLHPFRLKRPDPQRLRKRGTDDIEQLRSGDRRRLR